MTRSNIEIKSWFFAIPSRIHFRGWKYPLKCSQDVIAWNIKHIFWKENQKVYQRVTCLSYSIIGRPSFSRSNFKQGGEQLKKTHTLIISQGTGWKAPAKFICCTCFLVHFWASPDTNFIKIDLFSFPRKWFFIHRNWFCFQGKIAEMGRVLQSLQDYFHWPKMWWKRQSN